MIVRERYGGEAVLVGFSTYRGTVTAATDWDGPAERKRVRPGLPDSYEALLHETGLARLLLILRDRPPIEGLDEPRLERAIGVIYRPETERMSHYFSCAAAGAVRRGHSHRRDARGRTARDGLGAFGRAARDVPERRVAERRLWNAEQGRPTRRR